MIILILDNPNIVLDKKKSDPNILVNAIERYCNFILNRQYSVKIYNSSKKDLDDKLSMLLDCYKDICGVEKGTSGVVFIGYYNEINNSPHYLEEQFIINITNVLRNIDQYFRKINDLKVLIKMQMDWHYFNFKLQIFMHGRQSDLVNSKLGLLKLFCDNIENEVIDIGDLNNLIDISKTILEELYRAINEDSEKFSVNSRIKDNLNYCNILINDTQYLINILNTNDYNQKIIKRISNNIYRIFQFVSNYK